MESTTAWLAGLREQFAGALEAALTYLPSLIVALLVLVAGWLVARLARRAARRAAEAANRLLDRVFRRGRLASARASPGVITLAGELSLWIVLLITIIVAAQVAGLAIVTDWLRRLLVLLPNLVVGIAIIVVGYFVGLLVRERAQAESPLVGRIAQVTVLAIATIVGLDQVGVDVAVVIALTAVVAGGLVAGLFVAFGLGARRFVSNLIGARSARGMLGPGLRVRIGDVEGTVLEITATHIALDTVDGRLLVPGCSADLERILIITAAGGGDEHA